ncbi:FMN-binding glutamate synthase family protein [Rothia sp. AR01]|uniref:FMN-binding glutamate synthase family protein n=1 Tax=Rothia santali TaxID=2949643 RepID=A0A9X2HJJ9_9MICC|nr:FMN-binding glutamate synthase family protein [Rothia santali]MCP3426886.1 FMN-binding glutamate synthase family protein [Rothia santali]
MSSSIGRLAASLGITGAAGLLGLAARDRFQKKHTILRTFPVLGHARYAMEFIRPEIQQYFVENNYDGRPFDRDTRSMIYERAKGLDGEQAFGTERKVLRPGHDYLLHTMAPVETMQDEPRQRLGGPDCTQPYEVSLFNVSSMSFGALSANAVMAMNRGAALGGFSQETGEGGLSEYHLRHGGDLIWEFGSGYFGCRTREGRFNDEVFAEKAAKPQVKGILIKISQGAKPGIGGVLPGGKVTQEIADAREVPVGETCVSPAAHPEFSTPRELLGFVARVRRLAQGKPVGLKFCLGSRIEVLALCKAMRETGIAPDWITVDGSEGGTGAAPVEYEDAVGMPLTDGLITVTNALVGAGLRERIAIGVSGKVVGGADIVRRMALGADFANSARGMMMATGCIQAQRCNTNRCPSGVATQNPWLAHGVDVGDKSVRVRNYHVGTVRSAMRILASMGLRSFRDLGPEHVMHRIDSTSSASYKDLFDWLEVGSLLDGSAPGDWLRDWDRADPDSFQVPTHQHPRAA